MFERNFIIVIIVFAFTVAAFFEAEYRKTGQLSGTSQIIDMGGIAELNESSPEVKKTRQYVFNVSNNNFNPLINPIRNQIYKTRQDTIRHWEANLQALLELQDDVEGQAKTIQKVFEFDIDRVRERFPEIEKILNSQKELFAYILAKGEFSEQGQKDYILVRLNNSINTDVISLLEHNHTFQEGLQNLMENRAILQESIELGYEAIDKQLTTFHMVGDKNIAEDTRRHYLKVIEERQKVLIENLRLSYDHLDNYQNAIDNYIEKIVKQYQNGQLSWAIN